MGWCIEYQQEFDKLMHDWQTEIKDELKKDAPQWNSTLGVGKSPTVLINDSYKIKLEELKKKYDMTGHADGMVRFFLYISSFSSVILIIPEKISRIAYIMQKRNINGIMLKSSKQLYINLITGKERTAQESGIKMSFG